MSDSNAAEELRALLQNQSFQAPPTPTTTRAERGGGGSTDIPVLNELAALIGSLDSQQTPIRPNNRSHFMQQSHMTDLSVDDHTVISHATMDSSMSDMRRILANVERFPPSSQSHASVQEGGRRGQGGGSGGGRGGGGGSSGGGDGYPVPLPDDDEDFRVLRYGSNCVLRSRQGRYLCALPATTADPPTRPKAPHSPSHHASLGAGSSSHSHSHPVVYLLGADGQGVGDLLDGLVPVHPEAREDRGCIKYGDRICLRSPAAKERFLGIRDASRLGFWRNLIGQGEKWLLLKGSERGVEEKNSRGQFARTGDLVMLLSGADMLLSLSEGVGGRHVTLVHKDRVGVGGEVWQLDWAGGQPAPQWLQQRPYLSANYLLLPPHERYDPAPEVLARNFPGSSFSPPPSALSAAASSMLGEEAVGGAEDLTPLQALPAAVQEGILLREVLVALCGVEGVYVRVGAVDAAGKKVVRSSQLRFMVDEDSGDRGLVTQASAFLPLCESAFRVRAFIRTHSRYEYGSISHAIAAAVKEMLREFDLIIAQLEHLLTLGRLTLQKTLFLLQSSKGTLRALDCMTLRLQDLVGGQMMDALHLAALEQGDERVKKLYEHVLQAATRPFLHMLKQWLYEGELKDVYGEFFIQEHPAVLREALQEDFNAHYWEGRYTLALQHVPRILQAHAGKSLTAGKYLNVIRDCMTGEGFLSQDPDTHAIAFKSRGEAATQSVLTRRDLRYDLDGSSSLVSAVDEAYQFSSNTLLKILEEKYHLYSHLKSLRRFFLLEHGDFFVQFMDTAASELSKEAKDVALSRIRSLLQLAVHTSTLAADPNREELSCSLASHNLIQHLHLIQTAGGDAPPLGGAGSESFALKGSQGLKGVEALTLDYSVGWPLSIVLSRRAITKYQLLSRLLFFCKHVELKVLGCWKDHQNTKEMGLRHEMGATYALRHRMLHFLQNFVYYMTIEVFTPRSHELQTAMEEAKDMDEVLNLHEVFLDTCLKECLLASQDLLRILTKITTTCLLFADQMKRFSGSNEILDPALRGPSEGLADAGGKSSWLRSARIKVQADFISREVTHEAYIRMLEKFSDTFDQQLREFLDKLWTDSYRHHPQLSNLCVRLDYNGFYDSRFSSRAASGGSGL